MTGWRDPHRPSPTTERHRIVERSTGAPAVFARALAGARTDRVESVAVIEIWRCTITNRGTLTTDRRRLPKTASSRRKRAPMQSPRNWPRRQCFHASRAVSEGAELQRIFTNLLARHLCVPNHCLFWCSNCCRDDWVTAVVRFAPFARNVKR